MIVSRRFVHGVLFCTLSSLLLAGPASSLDVGQMAPDFTLAAPGNKQVRLADLLGKGPVVIYTFMQAGSAV